MANEEPTDEGRIRRVINDEIQLPRTGVITNVYEHAEDGDEWNFHVDVRIGPEKHPRRVPVAVGGPEMIAPPRSVDHPDGPDLALVQFLEDDETERPVVTNILYNNEDRPPKGQEGVFRLRRGSLFAEVEPRGQWARIAKKPDDTETPSTKVEINDSGNTTQVNIETDGDINLTADGSIVIDNGGSPKSVLTEDAVFEYEDTGDTSDGGAGTTTKTTTTVSNDETTDTQID